jgi:hypothetical protein
MMRWPVRNCLLALLVPCTAYAFSKLAADDFPFKGWAHFSSISVIGRKQLGYASSLPPFEGKYRRFEEYGRGTTRSGYFGYCFIDRPYWPGGDPGLGQLSPLPPLVKRLEIWAVAPSVLLAPLAAGWAGWIFLFIRYQLDRPGGGRGFEIQAAEEGSREEGIPSQP